MIKVNDNSVGFVKGTTVLMADGNLRPIESIVPGDWVMSFDTRSIDSGLEPREVIDIISYIGRDTLEVRSGDDALSVMPGQLFLTPGMDWSVARNTALITDEYGTPRTFDVIKLSNGKQKIYDIIVDDNHSLVANGFRVHNGTGDRPERGSTGSAKANSYGDRSPGQNQTVNSFTRGATEYGSKVSTSKDSWSFTNGDEGGFRTSTFNSGGGGGGGGGGPSYFVSASPLSGRRSKAAPEKPTTPPIEDKVAAYSAFSALQNNMDYICDIMAQYTSKNYFTIRTAVFNYTKYSKALADDALVHINASDISTADKSNLSAFQGDITNIFTVLEDTWSKPNDTSVNQTLITRLCLNVKTFVDRSQGVISKYIGSQASNVTYTIPGMTAPAKVTLPVEPTSPAYVKTAANTYVTTQGTVQATTGGLGASYTKTRVVRGYLYSYVPNKGWNKIGPADQYKTLS